MEKVPISFFKPLKLKPVLPPKEASTCANSVVGTFMQRIPRLKVEAAKPPKSVTTPPPTHTRMEERLAPCLLNIIQIRLTLSTDLFSSPQSRTVTCEGSQSTFSNNRSQKTTVCLSATINISSCWVPSSNSARTMPASAVN